MGEMRPVEDTANLQTTEQRAERDAAIADLVQRFAPGADAELYESMIRTVCRLARDGATRADAKLLDRALQELRYAFKTIPHSCPGRFAGARGNLRDSDTTPSQAGYPLFNWGVHFEVPVQ